MKKRWILPLVMAGVVALSGCSTTSMKGTPLFSGEYEYNEGSAEDRIPFWPLLYYRDPVLTVLYPLMEFTPKHQAVRPVYFADDLDTDYPEYNVAWPLAKFEPGNDRYRIFPVYWGDDYFNVFPLYWHEGDPWGGTGHNALFPLWVWSKGTRGSSLHLAWPIYARHQYGTWNGWHLWPLYGEEKRGDSVDRFVGWPLIRAYKSPQESGSWAFPLYAYNRNDVRTSFYSLPYSRSMATLPGAKSWDLALPIWYRSWSGADKQWSLIPALSWGRSDVDSVANRYALGLAGYRRAPETKSHYMLPFYYYQDDPTSTMLYTLPWWQKENADGTGFHALAPVFYKGFGPDYSSFYSFPWLSQKRADGSGWQTSIPFFFRSYADDASAFYSPLWMSEKHPDGTAWQASFPFYYGATTADGSVRITPLYARKLHKDGSTAWKCYVPFVYFNEDYDAHFMTPLGGYWKMGENKNWLALPLLSGGAKDATSGRNVYAAGLAGQRWDETGRANYIFPLYYRAPQQGTFVSIPYATWANDARTNYVSLPLLSKWYKGENASGGMFAAGLAGYKKGGADPYSYALPFYYSSKESFVSLPYASFPYKSGKVHLIPPLLSGWSELSDDEREVALLLGLVYWRSQDGLVEKSHVWPLYDWEQEDHLYTALYGHNKEMSYFATPLVGRYEASGGYDGSWAFPFYSHKRNLSDDSVRGNYLLAGQYAKGTGWKRHSFWSVYNYWHTERQWKYTVGEGNFPYWKYRGIFTEDFDPGRKLDLEENSKDFNYLLDFGAMDEDWLTASDPETGEPLVELHSKAHSLFLLWDYSLEENRMDKLSRENFSLLGFLYDKRREIGDAENPEHDYLRKRVLWHLIHYEKLNGDVTTDIFPAITVDSYQNGYKKVSVLWRLFRYEKDPENGTKKLDLFFIPLKR